MSRKRGCLSLERDMAEVLEHTEAEHEQAPAEQRAGAQAERAAGTVAEDEARTENAETDVVEPESDVVINETDRRTTRRLSSRRRTLFIVGALVLLVAALFGVRYWLYARAHETTDDAFIDGRIVQVSPKVSGYVAKVYVKDNQEVKAGDLIAELDARDYEAKLEQAKAALDAGAARLREAHTGVELTRANTRATTQQAAATVQQARTGVASSRAAAAAERSRIAQAGASIA